MRDVRYKPTEISNIANPPQFDADAIASELGYKDGGVVKMRWRQIKNKKLALAGASPGGIKKRAPKKATPKKVKAEDEAEDDAEQVSTPSKGPKKRVTKSKAAQQNEDGMKIKDEVAEEDE